MILITGAAGFIGYNLCDLLSKNHKIIGIDNINSYYDTRLKLARLEAIKDKIEFLKMDITNAEDLKKLRDYKIDTIIHLAAQAGVRYSVENPQTYIDNNVTGFLNILELARDKGARLLYASSSSVYGNTDNKVFKETDKLQTPLSIYAATKQMNEQMAYVFNSQYGLTTIGLRFFTVYGEYGRPDMALYKFTDKILKGEQIELYNNGNMSRDFTYIKDCTKAIEIILNANLANKYEIFNIASGKQIRLIDYLNMIENSIGKKAKVKMVDMQLGDMESTSADISKIKALGYNPATSAEAGIRNFTRWFKKYHAVS